MMFLTDILIVIFVSFVFTMIAHKFHFSEVIGLIAGGILLSVTPFKEHIFSSDARMMEILSSAGLFTLMFLSGFEVSWSMLAREKKDSVILTISTLISSLILGFVVLRLLGFPVSTCLIMGICFGVTAEATKAKVLLELKKIKSKLGALLIDAGIINDIIGVLALVLIAYVFAQDFSLSEVWILVSMISAFFLGILVHIFFNRSSAKIKVFEKILLYTVVPFFFVNIGLNFDFLDILIDYKIFTLVLLLAVSGQILGTLAVKRFLRINIKQVWLLGWGMNSKGAVELAIAYVSLRAGILGNDLYSALVAVSLISTVVFQIVIFRMVKNNPKIMN